MASKILSILSKLRGAKAMKAYVELSSARCVFLVFCPRNSAAKGLKHAKDSNRVTGNNQLTEKPVLSKIGYTRPH